MMKILSRKSGHEWWRRWGKVSWRSRMSSRSLQAQRCKPFSLGKKLPRCWFLAKQHFIGWRNWAGPMENLSMVCILMGTRGQTWWNTGSVLSNIGWDMSNDSINEITMGQNFHTWLDSQSLKWMDAFASSSSYTTNPPFSKIMNAMWDGATHPQSWNQRPRVMASH